MKRSIIFLTLISIPLFSQGSIKLLSQEPGYLAESEYYVFYSHYWFNMHHFLFIEALTNKVSQESIVEEQKWDQISSEDKEVIKKAVAYYKSNLLDQDLRFSEYMTRFKQWIIAQDQEHFSSVPDEFKEHSLVLKEADEIYRTTFWQIHSESNRNILNDNLPIIIKTEKEAVDTLSTLTRQYWQTEKIRVDISFVAKATPYNMRNRPYTSLSPTHIVMNASEGADHPRGNWIELLYHEASHNLIGSRSGFVGGTITDVLRVSGSEAPPSLWHAYLFYFSGKITQKALLALGFSDYELYMVRQGVFTGYFPHLEKHLQPYMQGEITLGNATESIIKDIGESSR